MSYFLRKIELILIRITFIQLFFLLLAQFLLYKKDVTPYLSKTIFAEGVFFQTVLETLERLDHLPTLWYYI